MPTFISACKNWSATDDCGNRSETSQTITVQDLIAPVLTGVPIDEVSQCGDNLNTTPPQVFATDNCDPSVFIQYAENTVPGNCPGSYVLTRTWRATDECGNLQKENRRLL